MFEGGRQNFWRRPPTVLKDPAKIIFGIYQHIFAPKDVAALVFTAWGCLVAPCQCGFGSFAGAPEPQAWLAAS